MTESKASFIQRLLTTRKITPAVRRRGTCGLELCRHVSLLLILSLLPACRATRPFPERWVVQHSPSDSEPPIRFQFPPPVDSYGGVVTNMRGRVDFSRSGFRTLAVGWFEVDVMDVTLGEPDLDDSVRSSKEFLFAGRHPSSRYVFQAHISRTHDWRDSIPNMVKLRGEFTLKGVTIPLDVNAALTLGRTADGARRLRFEADFSLEQLREVFHIAGPGGENEPAGNHLHFQVRTFLLPDGTLER